MRRSTFLVFASALIAFTASAIAITVPAAPVKKGDKGVLIVPLNALKRDGVRIWNGGSIYAADVRMDGADVVLNGDAAWNLAGFPSLFGMKVEKIQQQDTGTEIELREDGRIQVIGAVKFRFAAGTDPGVALRRLMVSAPEADAYLEKAYEALAEASFTGPLTSVPRDAAMALMRYAHRTVGAARINSTNFKNNVYMVVDLGYDTSVYNDLKLNQSARVARILNDKLLAHLKGFAKPVESAPQLYGLKIEFKIPHKSFLDKDAEPAIDSLELYASAADIKKFAESDITNQQFIDACVVIVNDNRIEVPMAASAS